MPKDGCACQVKFRLGGEFYRTAPARLKTTAPVWRSGFPGISVVGERGCKPDSVPSPKGGRWSFLWADGCPPARGDYPRARAGRALRPRRSCSGWGLPHRPVSRPGVPKHLFTGLPATCVAGHRLFSVALSPPRDGPSLTATLALRSPDFPLAQRPEGSGTSDHPPRSPGTEISEKGRPVKRGRSPRAASPPRPLRATGRLRSSGWRLRASRTACGGSWGTAGPHASSGSR